MRYAILLVTLSMLAVNGCGEDSSDDGDGAGAGTGDASASGGSGSGSGGTSASGGSGGSSTGGTTGGTSASGATGGSDDGGVPPPQGGSLRVVSWNLQHADCPSCQADKLEEQKPSVVLLQEAPSSAVETIRKELESALGGTWTSSDANGVAVLTRQTLLEPAEKRYLGPTQWGPEGRWGVRMKIDVGGIPVQVFGTHLDWYYDQYANHVTSRDTFLAWVDGVSGRKIAGGDLNAWTWGSPEQIATIAAFDQRLGDVCSSMLGSHAVCNDVRTNFSSGGSWRPDYIYRSSGTTPLSYQVVDRAGLSDHQLLVADIDVTP